MQRLDNDFDMKTALVSIMSLSKRGEMSIDLSHNEEVRPVCFRERFW